VPRILGAFLRQYPQVKLSLVSGNTERIVEAVAEEKMELGIIEGPAMRRDVKLSVIQKYFSTGSVNASML
jgi:DNA-binding transcriptional LysR family regulator